MNRTDFQRLAEIRIAEAQALVGLPVPMPDGAYYLAGYAVECASKRSDSMAQDFMVIKLIEEAPEVIRRIAEVVPLEAAFWRKLPEIDRWELVLATHLSDDGSTRPLHEMIHGLFRECKPRWIKASDIHPTPATDPMVRELVDLQRQYPDQLPMRLDTRLIGRRYVEDGWLYPPPAPADPTAIS